MDFTREPLIETVITPKEGHKLVLRPTNVSNQEEYSANAIEVVAFGSYFCFRSLEYPKAFLLPIMHYEVVEVKEARVVLKKPPAEKGAKIVDNNKKVVAKPDKEAQEGSSKEEPKKHEKKRARKHRVRNDKEDNVAEKATPIRHTLLPPPTSLISEQINRYKHYLVEHGALIPEENGNTEEASSSFEKTDSPLSDQSHRLVTEEKSDLPAEGQDA